MNEWREDAAFQVLIAEESILKSLTDVTNESDTRLRAIDTILFTALGWDKSEVTTEHYCRVEGYADYVFSTQGVVSLVLEAKRAGIDFLLRDHVYSSDPYALGFLKTECPDAMKALQQALG